jgi:ribonuclease J
LVVDVYTAFVLHLIHKETDVPVPGSSDLLRTYFTEALRDSRKLNNIRKTTDRFESSRIEMAEILASPREHVMVFWTSMLESDFGGSLPDGTTVLYSSFRGYLENGDWQTVIGELERTNGRLVKIHTSGHMLSSDIAKFVRSVNLELVIPIHTFEPDTFNEIDIPVRVMNDGEPITI